MDVASIANFLLFLGAFGASLALGGDDDDSSTPEEEQDSLYDSANYSRTDRLSDDDDDVTADSDNLAWFMEGGDDDLIGSSGADYADLGRGDDAADMGAGNDIVEAQDGNDSVMGGNGSDLALGGLGDDTLDGGLDGDSLAGEDGADLLTGGSGADILSGGNGNDVISGFTTNGGATASMTASDGSDQLFGGAGDDQLILGRGDTAAGGAGADTFNMDARWNDGTSSFVISDYAAEDSLVLHYVPETDPDSSDVVTPEIEVRLSADGESSLIVMDGTVVAVVEGVTDLTVDDITLRADTATDNGYQPENFDDVLPGTEGADYATGGDGADYGRMDAGDDSVDGGAGADRLLGEAGDDSLSGGDDVDTIAGGDGADDIDGGADNDTLMGDHGDDTVTGGDGVDRVWGGGGNDLLSGFDADGAGGTDTATDGADSLSGGDGDDTLILGKGDMGIGGDGADIFWLDASTNGEATGVVTVQDYDADVDRIELHYTPRFDADGDEIPPTITILRGPSDAYGVITFNGEPLAHVIGAADLTLAEVVLVRMG